MYVVAVDRTLWQTSAYDQHSNTQTEVDHEKVAKLVAKSSMSYRYLFPVCW
jgi:hypothetical protein